MDESDYVKFRDEVEHLRRKQQGGELEPMLCIHLELIIGPVHKQHAMNRLAFELTVCFSLRPSAIG